MGDRWDNAVETMDEDARRIKGDMHTAALNFVNQEIRSQVKGHLDELRMILELMRGDAEEQARAQEMLITEISRLDEQQEHWKTQAEELDNRIDDEEMGQNTGAEGDT